jgi:hypothetical protein
MRSTMHLLAADDVHWMTPLFEPAMVANSRKRLADFGMNPRRQERALSATRKLLASEGPLSRDRLTAELARAGIELDVHTRMHIFRLAVVSGLAWLGPDEGARTSLVLAEDWLGPRPKHDRDAALRELARRYLRAFAPATEADFAGWAGLPLRDVRFGLEGIARELREVRVGDGEPAWALRRRARTSRGRIVRLLPGWDTYLMGYRDRSFMVDEAGWKRIMPGGGMLLPSVVVDGRLAGTWSAKRGKGSVTVRVEMFGRPERAIKEAIQAEVADIGRFEGRKALIYW